MSSTESEYAALVEAIKEANWIVGFLTEVGYDEKLLRPVSIREDNQSTIALTVNHKNSARTKHIDVRNHYCRQEYDNGHVALAYVPTQRQAADIFTKSLGRNLWRPALKMLGMSSSSCGKVSIIQAALMRIRTIKPHIGLQPASSGAAQL